MFGIGPTIPKGKKVNFRGIPSLNNIDFILEEDLTIRLTSNFESLIQGGVGKVPTALIQSVNKMFKGVDIPVAFKQTGYQQWTGTEPLTLSCTIGVYMKTNAFNDVVKPSQTLMQMVVPSLTKDKNGLIPPGVSFYEVIFEGKKGVGFTIDVGPLTVSQCVLHGIEPTFSQEIDEDGYPIWSKLRIDVKTLFTANTGMIYNLFSYKSVDKDLVNIEQNGIKDTKK